MDENLPAESNFNTECRVPDLLSLAAMRVTIELWKQVNVVNAMADGSWKFYVQYGKKSANDEFETLTNIVYENLTKLKLPDILRDKCSDFIKQIGLHICEWIDLTQSYPPFICVTEQVESINWTVHGNIDKYNSIDLWLHNLKQQPNIRDHGPSLFSLACCFCVKNHIKNMWNLMTEDSKETFYNYSLARVNSFLINYWIRFEFRGLKSQFTKSLKVLWNVHSFLRNIFTPQDYRIENIDNLMFVHAVMFKYSVAAKYFFSKLTANNKEKYLQHCLQFLLRQNIVLSYREIREHVDITQYLFVEMEKRQQVDIFRRFMYPILMYMVIHWPYQNSLSHLIQQTGIMLRMNIFCKLLQCITFRIVEGKFVEKFLLEKIWHAVNNCMKRSFFSFVSENISYLYVLERNVHETFLYIMKDSTVCEKNAIYSFYEI